MAKGTVDDGGARAPSLWDLLARWNPAIGTLGAVVFQWFVPWFGWFIFAGILAQLNTRGVRGQGDLSTAQLSSLSREGILNSIVMVLNIAPAVLGITFFLLILLIHVFYIPPPHAASHRSHAAKPASHLARVLFTSYRRRYDAVTVALFVVLYALLVLVPVQWYAMTVLAAFGVVIPVYAIRHGTRTTLTYMVLLLLLGITLVTYPYRFGKDFYHFNYLLEVPTTSAPFKQLPLRLVPQGPGEGVTSFVSCDEKGWLLSFPGSENDDATPIQVSTLSDLPFMCQGNRITPPQYIPPAR